MTVFNSLKNKIQLITIPFFAFCYAADEDSLKIRASNDFSNLQTITPNSFITGAIGMALTLTIIVFFFILLVGGYRWITSSGDEKKLTIARSQITNGLIGLLIILSSWIIMSLLGSIFDIEVLKLTIPSFMSNPTLP